MKLTDWIVVAVIGAAAHAYFFTYFDRQYQTEYEKCVENMVGLYTVVPSKQVLRGIYATCSG